MGLLGASKDFPRDRRTERVLAVAQALDAVWPMGHAMSHSTHSGFSGPPSDAPICSRNGRLFVACFAGLCDFQSEASGVGHPRSLT